MSRTILSWLALAALLAVAVATAGWGSTSEAGRATPSPAPAPARGPGVSSDALAAVALVPSDLPAGFDVQSDLYGRELDDDPGGDVCGQALAGDAHRLAVRQLVVVGEGRRVTGEVASYERGGAAEVLRQVLAAVSTCPRGPAPHLLRGVQSLERRYSVVAEHVTPVSLTLLQTVTDRAGHRRRSEVVYQRHGEVVSVLTVDPVEGRDDDLVRRTTSVLGARLSRLRTSSIG